MSNDRELLELAAKAAGIHCKGWVMPGGRSDGWHGMYTGSDDDGAFLRWNPLTDDGDAFRLAVKLKFDIMQTNNLIQVYPRLPKCIVINQEVEDDHLAATRRAIVRAAAEIGRQMP